MGASGMSNGRAGAWVMRADDFVSNATNPPDQVATVRFLLDNGHVGMKNRTSIGAILTHLSTRGVRLAREQFQHETLIKLKRRGIVASLVYPGPQGGIFIPGHESELRKVAAQVIDRVIQELNNLEASTVGTGLQGVPRQMKELIEELRSSL